MNCFQTTKTPQGVTPQGVTWRTELEATRRWTDRPQRRRGYWTRDEFGRLHWHTYPPFLSAETEFRPTTRPLLVWPPIRTVVVQTEKNSEKETESRVFTSPVPVVSTSSQEPSIVATWWKRTPALKTVRGYWARDKWSGKMVWHTYTTSSSSPATLFQPSTSSGLKTFVTASVHLAQTLAQTTATTASERDERQPLDVDASLNTEEQTDAETSARLISSVTSTSFPSTPLQTSQSTTKEELHTSNMHRIHTTSSAVPVDYPDSRTNRTVTTVIPPNILPSPSTVTETQSQSIAKVSLTTGNDVAFDLETSTTERQRRTTVDNEEGYWLVDEDGKKLIYVRPNVTGHYADAWRQFIGAVTSTSAPQIADGAKLPSSGESYRLFISTDEITTSTTTIVTIITRNLLDCHQSNYSSRIVLSYTFNLPMPKKGVKTTPSCGLLKVIFVLC